MDNNEARKSDTIHKDFLSERDEHDKSFVIAIDGKFGSGKTTFLKLFIDYIDYPKLSQRKPNHVYRIFIKDNRICV